MLEENEEPSLSLGGSSRCPSPWQRAVVDWLTSNVANHASMGVVKEWMNRSPRSVSTAALIAAIRAGEARGLCVFLG